MISRLIQNQFDLLLFEEGCFTPLNWMLRTGHLDYAVYLNWKNGEIACLEDELITPCREIISALKEIKEYAALLQLESYNNCYESADNQVLKLCHSSIYVTFFTTIYEPAKDRMQMDLFFDSAQAVTISNLIKAITERQNTKVEDLLINLEYSDLEKHKQFSQIVAYEKEILQGESTSAEKIKILQILTPQAYEHLHRFAHDFLTPLWHKLSEEMAGMVFDPKTPEHHLSYTASKGFQWQKAIDSIEQEKNWNEQPILLFRYVESCFKLNREADGIQLWLRLFIKFPQQAVQFIKESGSSVMLTNWQYFTELDPELESSLFPAWMVMKIPALAKYALLDNSQTLQLMTSLVCGTKNEINIDLRAKLQLASPDLFIHYMNSLEPS